MTYYSGTNQALGEWERQRGDPMRKIRIDSGYDQVELAERANLSRSTVQGLPRHRA